MSSHFTVIPASGESRPVLERGRTSKSAREARQLHTSRGEDENRICCFPVGLETRISMESVAVHFVVECADADAEHAGGVFAMELTRCECCGDGGPLRFFDGLRE